MIFFPAARSQIREVSENKRERVQKIVLEAVEQSYGRVIPDICYVATMEELCDGSDIFILHQDGIKNISDCVKESDDAKKKIFFV